MHFFLVYPPTVPVVYCIFFVIIIIIIDHDDDDIKTVEMVPFGSNLLMESVPNNQRWIDNFFQLGSM